MTRSRWLLGFASFTVLCTGLASASASPAGARPGRSPVRAPLVDWRTYGFDVARTGYNPFETAIDPSTVSDLHELWSFDLGGTAANQPSFAAQVNVGGSPVNVVYQGASNGVFSAVRADSGQLLWRRFTGIGQSEGCGNYGISGSSPIDRARNLVFVPGGGGKVYAFNLATGAPAPGWPVTITTDPAHEYIWSALTLVGQRLYVPVASYCDVPPYFGRVAEVVVAAQPHVVKSFFVTGDPLVSGGGVWGWGGASVDRATGDVYVATGNALFVPESYGYSDQVVRLTQDLSVVAANYPGLNFVDVDFGSTPVLYQAPGCPPQFAVENKDGHLFVYDRDTISDGPFQSILVADFNQSGPIGLVAWDPVHDMIFMNNPAPSPDGTYGAGMLAFEVQPDCTLALAWQRPYGGDVFHNTVGTPTVANGVVYAGDGGASPSHLLAMDVQTGAILWSAAFTDANYSSPIVVDGHVFIATHDDHLHAYGL